MRQTKLRMDLLDWQVIEARAIDQMREAFIQHQMGKILLEKATHYIKKLGGQTMAEYKDRYAGT